MLEAKTVFVGFAQAKDPISTKDWFPCRFELFRFFPCFAMGGRSPYNPVCGRP